MSVKVTNLVKTYGTQKVLDNISFEANKSQILGFLGPNGAGKTTTMKIITGSLMPDSGKVFVSGMDISSNEIETKRLIGYLAEHNPLYQDMYIREFLDFIASIYKINDKNKKINQLIELTGLGKEQNKQIKQLSKGYKQRVGLAQVLIHDPEVLILDEPTSGLDPNQLREIRNVILETGKNKTVIFSTHIMQEVQALCDRVIILNNGRIVADESIDKLENYVQHTLRSVLVEFETKINISGLKALSSIREVERISENVFKVKGIDDKQIKRDIFDFAKKNDYLLISIHNENIDVDKVFENLTH
ncbi:MAG: gliding motility-associated ABC transporter ATP-binding subunit GldA [Saprospiraceae bacterium]|nr:gliding motility-associated ABC transporter ATP-binding subunit GldA [Saprospiraceae bacterium]